MPKNLPDPIFYFKSNIDGFVQLLTSSGNKAELIGKILFYHQHLCGDLMKKLSSWAKKGYTTPFTFHNGSYNKNGTNLTASIQI